MYESLKNQCVWMMSGLTDYQLIKDNYLTTVDLTADDDNAKAFRKKYKTYYRVRRNDEWCDAYFKIFQENRNNDNVDFDTIIDALYISTGGKVEASFSSKMLATINPDMPILDSRVLANMNLKIPDYPKGEKKKERAKEVYKTISKRYANFCTTPESDEVVRILDDLFPDYTDFSKTKKIDYFLWLLPRNKLEETGLFEGLLNG